MQNKAGYQILLRRDNEIIVRKLTEENGNTSYAYWGGLPSEWDVEGLILGPDEHTEVICRQPLIRFIAPVSDRKYFERGDSQGLLTTLKQTEFAEIVGKEMQRVKDFVVKHIDEVQYDIVVNLYQKLWIDKVQNALQFQVTNNRLWGTYIKDETTGNYTGIPVNFGISPEQFIKKFWENSNEDLLAWMRFKEVAVLFQGNMPKLLSRQFRYTNTMNYICHLVYLCANPKLLIESPAVWEEIKNKRSDLMCSVNVSGFNITRNKKGIVSIKGFSMANLNEEYKKFLAIGERYSDLY